MVTLLTLPASGDMRNLVKTVADVPAKYQKPITAVLNDLDFDVVVRNAIMLLVALTVDDAEKASDTILHLWYSALVRASDLAILQGLRPLVEDVVRKIAGKTAGSLQAKTWEFNKSSLRLVLAKESWTSLLAFFNVPADLSATKAKQIRTDVTMAPSRKDYIHRNLVAQPPYHRICKMRFREDGLLLPFGYSRREFSVPNPTFFQTASWPMMDSAEPCAGWHYLDILKTSSGPVFNDLYGKLYVHIMEHLTKFHRQIANHGIHLQLHHRDAAHLPAVLQPGTFARIETSNIADIWCLGVKQLVTRLLPLLQASVNNPHATLMTTFMNAVHEIRRHDTPQSMHHEVARVMEYIPLPRPPGRNPPDAAFTLRITALELVRDNAFYFNKYMKQLDFEGVARTAGARMKTRNSIVEDWPLRVKRKAGQPGAEGEFRTVLASDHTGIERYVEWARTA